MRPRGTRAAVMRAYGEPLSLEDVPLPDELAPGAALVRIACTTLCGTDAHLWDGRLAGHIDVAMPMIHGHEMVGRVVYADPAEPRDALGRTIAAGDRIVWSESVCGHCHACTVLGETVLCEHRGMGFAQRADRPPYVIGGLAEYVYVTPGAQRIVVPEEIEDPWAAAAGCAVKTVLRAFRNGGGIPPGSTVVVQGAGPLGLFATAYARAGGARQVITIGAPDERLAVARSWGADVTIGLAGTPEERIDQVLDHTAGRGAELVLDLAGAPTANREGVLMCARRGAYVVVGIAGPDADPVPMHAVMGRELRLYGSMNGDIGDLAAALDFLRHYRDRFDWNLIFDRPTGLPGATTALAAMAAATVIKPVIVP